MKAFGAQLQTVPHPKQRRKHTGRDRTKCV